MSKNALWFLSLFLVFIVLFFINTTLTDADFEAVLEVAVTADLRGEIMGYDYASSQEMEGRGLTYLSSLIKQRRRESEAFILIDAGGALGGNFVLDYILSRRKDSPLKIQKHPVVKAMEYLEYNAESLSYKEIKYGLDILDDIQRQNKVQFLNANIYDKSNKNRHFQPYTIFECVFKNTGRFVPLKVAVAGLMDSSVKQYLPQDLTVREMEAELQELMPQLKKEADFIIASVHLGALQDVTEELINKKLDALSRVEGLNLIVLGFEQIPDGHNGFAGTVNNIPVISPGTYAASAAFVRITMAYQDHRWQIGDNLSEILQSTRRDADFEKIMLKDHQMIQSVVQESLVETDEAAANYFSYIQDSFAEELLNKAQIDYMAKNIPKNLSGLPVVSLAAPMAFHAEENPSYVILPQGVVSMADVLKFYNRTGTLVAVQVKGEDIRDYLEWVSQAYIRVNTDTKEPQYFVNTNFPLRQFAMPDGVSFRVDLTQPSRYRNMSAATPNARRIRNLQYRNRTVRDDEEFLLVANSVLLKENPYLNRLREKGSFIWDSGVDVRAILLAYMNEQKVIHVEPEDNWRLTLDKQAELHFTAPADAAEFLPLNKRGAVIQFIRKSSEESGIYRYQALVSAEKGRGAAEDKKDTKNNNTQKKSPNKEEK